MMIMKGIKSLKGTSEVTEATLGCRTAQNQKLHFSPFKTPFNFIAPEIVHASR
jgi:hypothetical protein